MFLRSSESWRRTAGAPNRSAAVTSAGLAVRETQGEPRAAQTREAPIAVFVGRPDTGCAQIAAALTRHLSEDRVVAIAVAPGPARPVDDDVRTVMAEVGVDVCFADPPAPAAEIAPGADVIVTLGDCPIPTGARYRGWPVSETAGRDRDGLRAIRADIGDRVLDLLKELP